MVLGCFLGGGRLRLGQQAEPVVRLCSHAALNVPLAGLDVVADEGVKSGQLTSVKVDLLLGADVASEEVERHVTPVRLDVALQGTGLAKSGEESTRKG